MSIELDKLERLNSEKVAAMKDGWARDVDRMRSDAVAEESRREDHALALLLNLTGSGLIQWASPADLDELARDCVRTVRALEAEAAEATARRQPTPAERRPRSQRPAGPETEEGLGLGPTGGGLYDDAEEGERW